MEPALHEAANRGHEEAVAVLLAAGASVDQANTDGFTPIYVASANDHTAAVEMLLAAGAAVDRANGEGMLTALYVAAETGRVETLNVLLAAGAAIDQTNKEGSHRSTSLGSRGTYLSITSLYISHGWNVYWWGLGSGNPETVSEFRKRGPHQYTFIRGR